MKKIEAIIRPNRLEEVKEALDRIRIYGMTISQVMGCGRQRGQKKTGNPKLDLGLLSKVKIETVVDDGMVEKVIEAIIASARIGEIGDGKIFVSPIEEAIRIRTGERGNDAL